MFFKMRINVGSKNPVKIEAVREAFSLYFDNVNIKSFSVNSGVSTQPKSFEEIIQGARNRAINCFNNCDYGVGIETGIFSINNLTRYLDVGCCAIYDGKKVVGIGLSPGFEYPQFIIERIFQEGLEVGQIFDEIFKGKNINQKQGAVGILAHNKYSRKDFIKDGVIMALFPLLNKELYDRE